MTEKKQIYKCFTEVIWGATLPPSCRDQAHSRILFTLSDSFCVTPDHCKLMVIKWFPLKVTKIITTSSFYF